jgi:RNA polymerase sigma factor (sigma-70 family)
MDEGFAAFAADAIAPLTRLAIAFVGRDDAADLAHDCLVKVGLNWRNVRRDGNPLAYSRTALARLAIDNHRRRSRRRVVEQRYARMQSVPGATHPSDTPGPSHDWLSDAWRALSPNQRVALALRYLEDADMSSVAAGLACTEQTARSHISRGLARLRERAPENIEIGVRDGSD